MTIPRKLSPGDLVDKTARSFGAFVDAAEELESKRSEIMPGEDFTHSFHKGNIIQILNQSDQIVPWYGVLELGEPRHQDNAGDVTDTPHEDLFKNQVYVAGHAPTGDSNIRAPIGIVQKPLNKDCVGDILVEGITQAIVYRADTTEIEYRFAKPMAGDVTKLELAIEGPVEILWREEGYGDKWALVWLNKPRIMRIELAPDEVFMPGDASVECHLADGVEEVVITVFRPGSHHNFGIGRGYETGDPDHPGTEGYIIWSVERTRWEMLTLNSKLISEGKVGSGGIAAGAVGTVNLWWRDWDADEKDLKDSGESVEALNWCGPELFEGDKVVVSYDRCDRRWTIITWDST